MEHLRARRNNSSPPPVEVSAASPIQTDPLLLTPNRREFDADDSASPSTPPSTTDPQHAEKSPRRSKPPLFRGFERPSFLRIAILTVLCLITYPLFHVLTLVAKDRSLFIVRFIVAVWCSGAGFALGYILLKVAAQHLEAASEFALVGCSPGLSDALIFEIAWATVIHMSYEGGDGMKLRDLARGSGNPTSVMPALHMFRSRFGNRGTSKRSRGSYEYAHSPPSALCLLTLPQQATVAPVLGFLHRPRRPGSSVTLPIRTYRGDRNFCPRTYHGPTSSHV